MSRKVTIVGLASALLMSGLLVEASYGDPAPLASPDEITLVNGDRLHESTYALRDEDGERSASMTLHKGNLLDEDGNAVGAHRCNCVNVEQVGWTCTHILSLRAGPHTSRGTVVTTGVFKGFVGERLAITGGTGAYAGARGYAVSTVEGDSFVTTLHLLP